MEYRGVFSSTGKRYRIITCKTDGCLMGVFEEELQYMSFFDTLGGIICGSAEIPGKKMDRHKSRSERILTNC